MTTRNVHPAHISAKTINDLHRALLDIVSVLNRPRRDEALIREAGVRLERTLFPLLVGIERYGPIGIVELAERAGRDYTTVSRQVAKLEALGLVERQGDAADRRVRKAAITQSGKAMTDRVDGARLRLGRDVFKSWTPREIREFSRLMRKFADAVSD